LKTGEGTAEVLQHSPPEPTSFLFSERFACVHCGTSIPELEPRQFSFNSPYGACVSCGGLGTRMEVSAELVVGDPLISVLEGVILPWGAPTGHLRRSVIAGLEAHYGFDANTPWGELDPAIREVLLFGSGAEAIAFPYRTGGKDGSYREPWEGVLANVMRRYEETGSENVREQLREYMVSQPCRACAGHRLRPESLAVTVAGRSLGDIAELSVTSALAFFRSLPVTGGTGGTGDAAGNGDLGAVAEHVPLPAQIAGPILKEVTERLHFLSNVGLDYLTLGRSAETLSGGEAQRIRLATQIGSRLVGVLYILDEPSIGLHQRDNERLLGTLRQLRDLGNTVIVVEHDEETIRAADHIIDLGPGAGRLGGHVVAAGTLDDVLAAPDSLTGAYLRGDRFIPTPQRRRPADSGALVVRGARAHNLKDLEVRFPLGSFTCVTGVSGSGKSTLVHDILYRALERELCGGDTSAKQHLGEVVGSFDRLDGAGLLDAVVLVDQSPIGRTPRSNPVTYIKAFDHVRDVFAKQPLAKQRGYPAGHFSFNVKGGRCEACQGDGVVQVEMVFMADVYIPCEVCGGARYKPETLEVKYRGHDIRQVLDLTIDEAIRLFMKEDRLGQALWQLQQVGLGYLRLGQPAPTLSGGEAQRLKIARELIMAGRKRVHRLYILDEPTTGLSGPEVRKLLDVLRRLLDAGHSVVLIEHNLEVILAADWVIDLGPEAGAGGGRIMAMGRPEAVAAVAASHTGRYLREALGQVTATAPVGGARPAAPPR
jgi:excinuclease ABC subunit A